MKKFAITFLVINSALCFSQPSDKTNTITTAVPFLLITPDARGGGLGDAGCALSPDVYSNYWNASENVFSEKKFGASASYTPWLRALDPNINLFDVTLYKKIGKKNGLGFSGKYFRLGNLTVTDILGNSLFQFQPYEYSISACFSRKIKHNFSAGFNVTYIHSRLANNILIGNTQLQPGQSIAVGFSCYKRDTFNFINIGDVFAWGVNISNIGSKISYSAQMKKDFIPQSLRIGLSYKINLAKHHSLELIGDANKLLVPTPPKYATDYLGNPIIGSNGQYVIQAGKDPNRSVFNALYSSFYDAPGGFKEEWHEINFGSGIEYWYYKTLAVRTGYFYEHPTKGGRKYFTFGIGGRYKGIELDIAYLLPTEQRSPLQNTMRFTLSWGLNAHKKGKNKKSSDFTS